MSITYQNLINISSTFLFILVFKSFINGRSIENQQVSKRGEHL